MQYIVKGDSEKFDDCLVFVIGHSTKEYAQSVLDRIINNPTENDKRIIKGMKNLRIEEVDDQDCWWNEA